MPRKSDAKLRTIHTAAHLFRRNGYAATGLNEIVDLAGTPRGSLYHYFPDGKEELAETAIDYATTEVAELIDWAIKHRGNDPQTTVRALGRGLARWLEQSDFADGCPIATIALETAHASDRLRIATDRSYTAWTDQLSRHLIAEGHTIDGAERIARAIISGLEGSLILARCARNTRHITESADVLAMLVKQP